MSTILHKFIEFRFANTNRTVKFDQCKFKNLKSCQPDANVLMVLNLSKIRKTIYLNRSNNSILYMISLFQILAQRIFARGRINWLFPRVTLKIHDQIYHKNPRILEQEYWILLLLEFLQKEKKNRMQF